MFSSQTNAHVEHGVEGLDVVFNDSKLLVASVVKGVLTVAKTVMGGYSNLFKDESRCVELLSESEAKRQINARDISIDLHVVAERIVVDTVAFVDETQSSIHCDIIVDVIGNQAPKMHP